MQARYAIYYTPSQQSELYQLASLWLGHDLYHPARFDHPDNARLPECLRKYLNKILQASRYGFHATLKAPFRLNDGFTRDDLGRALSQFTRLEKSILCDPLRIKILDGFIALQHQKADVELTHLANRCVENLDYLRAPLNSMELEKRQPEKLSDRQRKLLDRWGYPFVKDEFRFHLTLSDRLDETGQKDLFNCLSEYLSPALGSEKLNVDRVVLCRQKTADDHFEAIETYLLQG